MTLQLLSIVKADEKLKAGYKRADELAARSKVNAVIDFSKSSHWGYRRNLAAMTSRSI
jgi:hypothetical protein